MNYIQDKLLKLPNLPGVYIFKDKNNQILYIGKALNLSNRVASYFREKHIDRPHIIPLIPIIAIIETIETLNEIEALVLESALIKKHLPKYNILLKDDKSYAWIYIETKSHFPSVRIVRTIRKNEYKNGKLFGPFPKGLTVKKVYKYIRRLFPFCNCKSSAEEKIYFEMGLCPGPILGQISESEYRDNIEKLMKFLNGNLKSPINELESEMRKCSLNRDFEKAALFRDKINDLKYISSKNTFNYFDDESKYIEKGVNINKNELDDLQTLLQIQDRIKRIECYDISNTQGTNSVGSMVVMEDMVICNTMYRSFNIKTVDGSDDFASLAEVIKRRINHIGMNLDISLTKKPDIILVDGGIGQLNAVKDFIPEEIALMGISKGKKYKRKGGVKKDEFWIFDRNLNNIYQIPLKTHRLLSRLRDEAHRFAIKLHRRRRSAKLKLSVLDSIPGIGLQRRKILFQSFKNIDKLRLATFEEINMVIKNAKITENIVKFLQSSKP